MKKTKIIYWVSTLILAAFILPGIFYINSEMAIEGTRHLMLPEWFRLEVSIASFVGGLVLLIPVFGNGMCARLWTRFKEWAYVGLGIVYVSALIAHLSVDGFVAMSFAPVIAFLVLAISYSSYHKIKGN